MIKINKADFDEKGYLIEENVISEDLIESSIKSLITLLNKYNPELFGRIYNKDTLTNEAFNEKLSYFRSEHPDIFGAIYDTMQSCVSTKKNCCSG